MDDDEEREQCELLYELLYDILKDYPTGITSEFLEEQYENNYVSEGLAKPLPKDWLKYVRMADEFEVRQVSTFTMLYIANKDSVPKLPILLDPHYLPPPIREEVPAEVKAVPSVVHAQAMPAVPLKHIEAMELEPWSPSSMPTKATEVHILSATDPDNISVRLCSWDPMPDYLYTALSRDFNDSPSTFLLPSQVKEGILLAAKLDNSWERVKVVRRSKNSMEHWVVYAVDVGFFHLVARNDLRPLTESVHAFTKMFLAKCKIGGIQPTDEFSRKNKVWPRNTQQAVYEMLMAAQGKTVELVPIGEWQRETESSGVPFASCRCRLVVEGKDIAQQLIEMGLAQAV